MTQEEKNLLLEDLCGRLSYGMRVSAIYEHTGTWHNGGMIGIDVTENEDGPSFQIEFDKPIPFAGWAGIKEVKPYLRPMSSMTKEEYNELCKSCTWLWFKDDLRTVTHGDYKCYDWLNAHHFDFRGLIEADLALEAPEDMYKTK